MVAFDRAPRRLNQPSHRPAAAQDLAVANNVANSVAILVNNGAANFEQAPTSPEAADQAPSAVAFADLDGDSDQDLGAANVNSDNVTILPQSLTLPVLTPGR